MSEIIHTQKRNYKYNGPVNSSDYNQRIEENYKDLVYLYNKAKKIDLKLGEAFERVVKDNLSLSYAVNDLSDRIAALESNANQVSMSSFSQIDYTNFIGTSFAISGTDLLTFNSNYNYITLPKLSNGSHSKLKFSGSGVGQVVPPSFKSRVEPGTVGVDVSGATVDSTPVYNSILDDINKVWSRTIVSDQASQAGAQMYFYFNVPQDASGSKKVNYLRLSPYPSFGSDIVSIEYTVETNPTLSSSDNWVALNSSGIYDGDSSAIGRVPPGGWSSQGSDTIRNCGPVAFNFAEIEPTAFRIKFRQRNYYVESGKYIYSYGLSDLDVGYNKYLNTGKIIIKYTPSNGDLISAITNVTPKIYNVPENFLSDAFSYKVIYSNGANSYTDDESQAPGAAASVWVEVTLNKVDDTTPPILTDLIINYDSV